MKNIVLTGASTGIGFATATYLAQKGYHIFAGARKQEDIDRLEKIENITSIKLDVTKDQDISNLTTFLRDNKHSVYGLVNNAGISEPGPLVEINEALFRNVFEVNVFGAFRMTQAVFPFIKVNNGRIINIASFLGKVTVPFNGPYCMSKHELESFSDALRRELNHLNIKVSCVEPGVIKTPIWKKSGPINEHTYSAEFKSQYENLPKILLYTKKSLLPEDVAKVVFDALESDNPKPRYLITEDETYYNELLASEDLKTDQFMRNILNS